MTQRKGSMTQLKDLLPKAFQKVEIPGNTLFQLVVERWDQIAGPAVASRSTPGNIRNKILWVNVDHQTWAQELALFKPMLLNKISRFLPQLEIRDIRFTLKREPPFRHRRSD